MPRGRLPIRVGFSDIQGRIALGSHGILGNVSYACPSIQPVFSICTKESNHTAPFADTTNLPDSYARALSCAKGLAAVAIRVVVDYKFAEAVRLDFEMEG